MYAKLIYDSQIKYLAFKLNIFHNTHPLIKNE